MRKGVLIGASVLVSLCAVAGVSTEQRYTLKVPNGLAFSEFRGYEGWSVISVSVNGGKIAAILGNPVIVRAYESGIPGNGKPFPDGSKMAKIHWIPKTQSWQPGPPMVPGTLHDIDFMVKDSKRFADSGGWGYGAFEYNAASGTFRTANLTDKPPQAQDAKCGFGCHILARDHDYVFTEYGKR